MGYSFGNKVLENGNWVVVCGYTFREICNTLAWKSVTFESRVVTGVLGVVALVTLFL